MAGDKDKKKKRSSKKGSKDRAKSRAKPLDAEAFDRAATTLNDATAKLMRAAERHALGDVNHDGAPPDDRARWYEEGRRAGRDEAACRAALQALQIAARGEFEDSDKSLRSGKDKHGDPLPLAVLAKMQKGGSSNLLARAVECARQDATLGEISQAMETAFGRYDTVPKPVRGVYASAYAGDPRYAAVVKGVETVTHRLGRKPKMMVAKMGQDGHDRGANVIASAFADIGFEVVSGPLFQTPEESARMALDHDVDAIGASSLADDVLRQIVRWKTGRYTAGYDFGVA